MGSNIIYKSLCASLALSFLVPPNVLLAQELPKKPAQPKQQQVARTLDLEGLDRLDVEPRLGMLMYRRTDLVVGEGPEQFPISRTYRPGAGDTYNMSLVWASALDSHLDVHPNGDRASFVDSDGNRVFFTRDERGQLVSDAGPLAKIVRKRDGFVLSGLGDSRTYRFDRSGWLLSRTGPNMTLTYRYDAQDRLMRIDGPWGAIRIKRDAHGILTAIRTPDGRIVRYERDGQGYLTKVSRESRYETYTYDSGMRLTSVADGKALIAYDVMGRVIRLSGSGIHERSFRYRSGEGEWAAETHITRGERTSYVRISRDGRKIERTTPEGLTSLTELDDRNRPVRIVTADGLEHTRAFDAQGRLESSSGPRGETRYEYDSKVTDRPTRVTLENGSFLTFSYDLRGRLTQAKSSTGAVTTYTYDAQGRMATKTDPRGAVTRYERDKQGRLIAVTEDGVGTTRYLRDDNGRLIRVKQPDGRVVRLQENASGKLTRISSGRGPTTTKSYDSRGRILHYSDPFGRSFDYDWDAKGDLRSVKDSVGQLISFDYDPSGRLISITDGEGNLTTITHDGRTVTVDDPTQGKRTIKRDAKGRMVEEIRGGESTTYTYDAVGQIVARTSKGGVERFNYDAYGQLIEMVGPDGKLRLDYDDNGRLKSIENPAIGKSVSYGYSKTGDRTSLESPAGKVNYTYDVQGRVKTIETPEGDVITLEHHPDGRRKAIHYPNGVVTTFGYKRTRLNEVLTKKGDVVIDVRRYGYDAQGRVAWTSGMDGDKTHYTHDARGRLTEVKSDSQTVTYTYDLNGNRVQEITNGKVVESKIGAGNRVVERDGETFTYGETGTITTSKDAEGTTRFVYDNDDQLVRVERPDGEVVTYGYAPNGTRLWRKDGSGKTHYLHDLADVVGEFDGSGELQTSYVHGPEVDDVLSAKRGDEQFFYHYDLVRSVTAITGKDGRVAARYGYDAFGQETRAEGDAAAWNPFRYTSRSFDQDTGLYNYRARTYDPTLGRFTSADPAGFRGGLNLYAYAANDPVLFNDPFGFWPDWLDSAAGWALDRVDDLGSAIDTGVTWVGTKIDQGVTAAGEWAGQYLPEEVNYVGRQAWAFTRGFGKGIYGATKGVVNMVRHPIDTYNGIKHAIENWDETWEAIKYKWDEYMEAMANDPEKFAEMTGVLTAEVIFSLAGTKGLDKLAKGAKVGAVGRTVANGSSRVSRAAAPVVNGAGGAMARTFPRAANAARTGRVMSRARNIELARRAANPGHWATRVPRRVASFARDVGRYGAMGWRAPGATIVYTGLRMGRMFGGLIASTGRGLWTASKWGGIPILLAFEDNITDAIQRSANREEAMRGVKEKGQALLDDAAGLTPEQLAVRVREVGEAYNHYRNYMLKPIHDEDMRLERALAALEEQVAKGEIPAETIDARVVAMFKELGRRQQNLMADLYDRNRDVEHDMLNPSPNRTISFQDEIDLLTAVKAKVTNPESIALLDARIADVQATMEWEYDLFRRGDHETLISGIAGPPRPVGEEPGEDIYGMEGMDYGSQLGDVSGAFEDPGSIYDNR